MVKFTQQIKFMRFRTTFWRDVPLAAEQNVWLSTSVRCLHHGVNFDDKLQTLSSSVTLRQINRTHLNCRSALNLLGEINSDWPVQFTWTVSTGLTEHQELSSQFRVVPLRQKNRQWATSQWQTSHVTADVLSQAGIFVSHIWGFLDLKLSPCSECCVLSSG
jgi:hypothetical protein